MVRFYCEDMVFSDVKANTWIYGGKLFQLKNNYTGPDHRVHLDEGIVDLVLDFNRLPFAVTGSACKGHFYVDISDFETYKVDMARDGSLTDSSLHIPFGRGVSEHFTFGYRPPEFGVLTSTDESGVSLCQRLADWLPNNYLRITDGCYSPIPNYFYFVFAPDPHIGDEKVSFDEAFALNSDWLEKWDGLREIVRSELFLD